MKRVGIDAHILTGKFQGSRTYLRHFLRGVATLDTENHYILYSFDPVATRAALDFPNFEHRSIALRPAALRLLFYWPYVQIRDRLDYLVTHYVSPPVFRRRQIVFVYDILYETYPHLFRPFFVLRNRLFTRLSARRARAIVTISRASKHDLEVRYGIEPARIHLAPPGTEGREAAPGAPPADVAELKPYILFVGRLEPRKNLLTLLDAFARLRRRDLTLVLIGEPDFGYRSLLERLATAERVRHLGGVPDGRLEDYYGHAELFVYPSIAEGFGIPVLEALSHGLRVVTSRAAAISEAAGDLAHSFDPSGRDPVTALADAMEHALAEARPYDPARLARHLGQFTWEGAARVLVALVNAAD